MGTQLPLKGAQQLRCFRPMSVVAAVAHLSYCCALVSSMLSTHAPFPQIDIIGAVVIVWRVRGKTIRSVLCNNCAQCDAHTYEQTNSSPDWVLSHLGPFHCAYILLSSIHFCMYYVYYCILCACVGL